MKSPEEFFKEWDKDCYLIGQMEKEYWLQFAQAYANHLLDVKDEEIKDQAEIHEIAIIAREAFENGVKWCLNHLKQKNGI